MRSLTLLLAGILLLSSCTTEATRKSLDGGVSEKGSSSGADVSTDVSEGQGVAADTARDTGSGDVVADQASGDVVTGAGDTVPGKAAGDVVPDSGAGEAVADAAAGDPAGNKEVGGAVEKTGSGDTVAEKPNPSAKGSTVKPGGALVDVRAELDKTSATLAITFSAPAREVAVRVWGTDGLKVTSEANPIVSGSFERGEVARLKVDLSAPDSRCDLAVGVSGEFAGRKRSLVRSFTVNPEGETPDRADIQTDAEGRKIRIIKSGE